jgi:superfamily II DNA or RNA helicase
MPGPRPSARAAREVLGRGRALVGLARAVTDADRQLREEVEGAAESLRADAVRAALATTSVDRLAEVAGGRLPLRALQRAGLNTVADVLDVPTDDPPGGLAARARISPAVAAAVYAAATEHAAALAGRTPVRIATPPAGTPAGTPGNAAGGTPAASDPATRLVVALHRHRRCAPALARAAAPAERLGRELPPLLDGAARAGSRLRLALAPGRRRAAARAALARVEAVVEEAEAGRLPARLERAVAAAARPPASPRVAWRDYERKAADYHTSVEEVLGAGRDLRASRGHLPEEVAAYVQLQELDDTHRRVALRGYQAFGARFALAQRRVLLGDEMGLGKTVQAIAAMAHLRAIDRTHFLVVCPASVLVNWTREVSARSRLRVHRLHGDGRDTGAAAWARHGGVGVTTFDALRALPPPPDLPAPAMLVVDEAHYVKNPGAQRSAAVAAWARSAERVLFLTGTPLENRVGEFTALVSHLQPALVPAAAPGPHAFRRAVAPAYLRRNTEDVLGELPPLVRVEEWVELRGADADTYRDAVAAGSFMAMRRAAYTPGHRGGSAKLDRLCEIVEEAAANRRRVVVFSNFRDVLRVAAEALAPVCPVVGPISGAVRAADRQALVDEFAGLPGGAALVSQIQAGGVGLNMQAASVVVLCEPQLKPTIEDQAVARAHRMGQVRSVQVHRLLAADSVDERLLELLRAKTELFDDHARRSETAAAASAARDVSDVELARRVVAEEQRRLAVGPANGPDAAVGVTAGVR